MAIKQLNKWLLGLAAAIAIGTAQADVIVDEDGVGFVGKGDVQSAFGWNNAALQANAGQLRFRLASGDTASWACEGINPAGQTVTNHYEETYGVSSSVAFDARKNRQGQITGFHLNGIPEATTASYETAGSCATGGQNWQQLRVLVGDVLWEGTGEPALQVSADDGDTWVDLPITY